MLLTLFLMSVYDLFLTGKKKIIKQYHKIHFVKGYVCVYAHIWEKDLKYIQKIHCSYLLG